MERTRANRSLITNELTGWTHRRSSLGAVVACGIFLVLAIVDNRLHHAPLFVAVLGGPGVRVVYGHLGEARTGWPWFLANVLFAVSVSGLIDSGTGWIRLTLVREVTRFQWAACRLGSIVLLAMGFLAFLVAILGLASGIARNSAPLITRSTLWEVGLWALGLTCIGWFEAALTLLTGHVWLGVFVTFLLLVFAEFGNSLAPFMPFAQWIVGMHNLPGTLSVVGSTIYLLGWLVLAGITMVWASHYDLD